MYGKEIDSNIIQKGGGSDVGNQPTTINQARLQSNINKIIMKKGIFENTFDSFQNILNKSKLLRILFMVFFYLFFYQIFLSIFSFFDVDNSPKNL